MPLPNLSVPQFPFVPNVPGVPPLLRGGSNLNIALPSALSADGASVQSLQGPPEWGIFDDSGNPVIEPESVVSFEYSSDFRISDYPIEEGGFQSYNKVQMPFDGRLTFAQGGTETDRTSFLDAIEQAVRSLDLYTIVTPEVSYTNVNLTHYDYRRTSSNGATLLSVDVWGQEVRTSASSQFTTTADPTSGPATGSTQTPAAADPVNDGAVQTQPLTAYQGAHIGAVGN